MQPLILIVTRNCNLRCNYCDVDKKNISMEKRVAQKATFLYFDLAKRSDNKKLLIRFFGGEPLMNFNLVKYVVLFAKRKAKQMGMRVKFDLTTNCLLLDDEMIKFFNKNKEIDVIISLDGNSKIQNLNRNINNSKINSYQNIIELKDSIISLPSVTVNMVAAPNQVKFFYKNFVHNYDLGFKRFNFLPAYFVNWEKENLRLLISEFKKILYFLESHNDILIKNSEIFSDAPFFNSGFVVDCNGDLFGTNMILSKYFMHLDGKLVKGNVLTIRNKNLLNFDKNGDIVSLIRDNVESQILYSTLKVDKILTNFVRKLLFLNNKNHDNKKNRS